MSNWPEWTSPCGRVRLYLGDCLDVLPTLGKVDAVVTDPVWPNCPEGLLPGSDDPYGLFAAACEVMPDAKRWSVIMRHDSDPRFLAPIPLPYARAAFLPYVMPGYIGRYLGGDEIAYCFGEPIPSRPGQKVIPGRAEPVQPGGRPNNGHPCSRAPGHMTFVVRWWSEPDEVVIDPFMGSGRTGESCIRLGRQFIGIEINPEWFALAVDNCKDALGMEVARNGVKQKRMFVPDTTSQDASVPRNGSQTRHGSQSAAPTQPQPSSESD